MREGICRVARFPNDFIDGDPSAGGGGGVSCAGESCGDSSELMSMAPSSLSTQLPLYARARARALPTDAAIAFLAPTNATSLVLSAGALLQGPLRFESEADGVLGEQHGLGLESRRRSSAWDSEETRASDELETAAPKT